MTTSSSVDIAEVLEVRPGLAFSYTFLRQSLTDMNTTLFFAGVYRLTAEQTAELLRVVFPTSPLIQALTEGDHSTTLQDEPIEGFEEATTVTEVFGQKVDPDLIPEPELLFHLWQQSEVRIAKSITDVADAIGKTIGRLPSNEAHMVFRQLAAFNVRRNSIGDYRALLNRRADERHLKVLVILDDSGSMSEMTIREIVHDVVALSYRANATLAQVSSTCRVHAPGTYTVDDVLEVAEYGGTQYHTLKPLLDEDWDEVITIADYDSQGSAMNAIARCKGRIGKVTDVSLVHRSTFLSEVVGQLAQVVRPMLIAPGIRF